MRFQRLWMVGACCLVSNCLCGNAWTEDVPGQLPKAVSYDQCTSVLSSDGKPMETTNSTVLILGGQLKRTEYQQGTYMIVDNRRGKCVSVDPGSKRFTELRDQFTVDPKSGKMTRRDIEFDRNVDFIASILDVPSESTPLTYERRIDGQETRGLQIQKKLEYATLTTTYWINTQTQRPIQIESELQPHDVTAPKRTEVMSCFNYEPEITESMFSTDAPTGYKVTQPGGFVTIGKKKDANQ